MAIQSTYGIWGSFFYWPYPKVVYASPYYIGFAVEGTNLYAFEMRVESNNWTATYIKSLGALSSIVSVDVAGFDLYYVIAIETTTGQAMYGRDVTVAPGLTALSSFSSVTGPIGTTACNFKGQLVIGSVYSTGAIWTNLGYCSVAWSGIGNSSFDPGSGNPTAGFAKMHWDDHGSGRVFKVARLGDVVAVYGDNGRALLVPYQNNTVVGLAPKELTGAGIPYISCVGGDVNTHCFIDTNHDVWIATGKPLEFRKLGYREWMDDLVDSGDDVVVNYSGAEKKFFISDGTYGFVLTEFGLYSTDQCPTSVFDYGGTLAGLFDSNEDYETRIAISQTDFGVRGLKTLETIEFATDHDHATGDEDVRIDTKYDLNNGSWRTGDWTRLNPQGLATPIVTGSDFRIRWRGPDYRTTTKLTLDDCRARFKISDKRGLRGIYAG